MLPLDIRSFSWHYSKEEAGRGESDAIDESLNYGIWTRKVSMDECRLLIYQEG